MVRSLQRGLAAAQTLRKGLALALSRQQSFMIIIRRDATGQIFHQHVG
jgi:hypothetical protein